MAPVIIDAHAHCGVIDRSWPQSINDYGPLATAAGIDGAALFSPVYEIYDRYDRRFADTDAWQQRRRQSNTWLTTLAPDGFAVYPYFFIWNDFVVDQLTDDHCGIKWHRHAGEPIYHYDDPKCRAALDEIRRRRLPVVLEEEAAHTIRFVRKLADGITVIIPHLGMLNGGFEAIAASGLWELDNVWADTALAPAGDVRSYIRRYGHRHLMFGSDFPFGDPAAELDKVRRLGLEGKVEADVVGGNFLRLQANIRHRDQGTG